MRLVAISLLAALVGLGTAGPSIATASAAPTPEKVVEPGLVYIQSQQARGIEQGTGMVISADGDVLTSYHLVHDAEIIGVFTLGDRKVHDAYLLGAQPEKDIAVLHVMDVGKLPLARITSTPAKVGQAVLAVGNGGGKLGTRPGKVNATGRRLDVDDPLEKKTYTLSGLLELTCKLEPGDSGGAVVAVDGPDRGKVVAMTAAGTFKKVKGRNVLVAGFAIPIKDALAVADQIRRTEAQSEH